LVNFIWIPFIYLTQYHLLSALKIGKERFPALTGIRAVGAAAVIFSASFL